MCGKHIIYKNNEKAATEKKYEQQIPTESSRVVRGAGERVPNTSQELHTERMKGIPFPD